MKRKAVKRRSKRKTVKPNYSTRAFFLYGNHDGTATAWDAKERGKYLFFLHSDEKGRYGPNVQPGEWLRVKLVKAVYGKGLR